MFKTTVKFFSSAFSPIINTLKKETIQWSKTSSPTYPYKATVDGQKLRMKMGGFPEQPMYSIHDKKGNSILEVDDFYPNWYQNDLPNSPKK